MAKDGFDPGTSDVFPDEGLAGVVVHSRPLKAIIERIEAAEERRRDAAEDVKEIYAHAKAQGFDTKIVRALIKERRTNAEELSYYTATLDLYRDAVADLPLFQAGQD